MGIKQISLWLPNEPGKLCDISEKLGRDGVNIRALSVGEHGDRCRMRFICDDPTKAMNILRTHNFQFEVLDVLAIETIDHPGGLNSFLKPLKEAEVNVHYLYPFIGRIGDNAILILGVSDLEKATTVLRQNYLNLLGEELYSL